MANPQDILDYLGEHGPADVATIAAGLGAATPDVGSAIASLNTEEQLVEVVADKRWALTEKGRRRTRSSSGAG